MLMIDDGGNVAGQHMHVEVLHRPLALPDAARLRPQHPETIGCQLGSSLAVILAGATQRRQEDDERAATLRQRLDAGAVMGDHEPIDLSRGIGRIRRRGQHCGGDD